MENKNTTSEVFGKRLKELRKSNGYTIEQFADMVGIAKSTLGYYENDKRLPDIEILTRIADALNVQADYLLGRTNTTAMKGKLKTVCEFTGLSDTATVYLAQLVKDKDYGKLAVINHLFDELTQDYAFFSYEAENGEETANSVLGALFLYYARCLYKEDTWNEFVDLCDDRNKEILSAAYKQYLLNQVTDAVKASAEAYREYNKPWE